MQLSAFIDTRDVRCWFAVVCGVRCLRWQTYNKEFMLENMTRFY